MKKGNYLCPIIALIAGSLFTFFGIYILGCSVLAIGARGMISAISDQLV